MADTTLYGGGLSGQNGLAYATEILAKSQWDLVLARMFPLFSLIKSKMGAKFNTSEERGSKMIIPTWINKMAASETTGYGGYFGADSSNTINSVVNAVKGRANTHAGQFTPQQMLVSDGKAAEFPIAEYLGIMATTHRERQQYEKATTERRASVVQGRVDQLMEDFAQRIAYDLCTLTTTGSESKVMSIPYAISTTNVVGGIDPSDNARWASQVATGGPWISDTLTKFMRDLKGIKAAKTDLIVISSSAASDANWEKFTNMYQNAVVRDNLKTQEYGADVYRYMGADVIHDQWLPDNDIHFYDTSAMFFNGNLTPVNIDGNGGHVRLPQTTVDAEHYGMFLSFGCYPNKQGKLVNAVS